MQERDSGVGKRKKGDRGEVLPIADWPCGYYTLSELTRMNIGGVINAADKYKGPSI
jgi:hypothetical protein